MRATKCIAQPFKDRAVDDLLRDCLTLTYNAIKFASEKGIDSRRGMKEFRQMIKGDPLPFCYKAAVVTRACAILRSRRKSESRGIVVRRGSPLKPAVCIVSGFFVTAKGRLFIPLRRDKYVDVMLNGHMKKTISGKGLRSLTLTSESVSLCYSVDVEPSPVKSVYGVDRNEKNITFGDKMGVVQIDVTRMVTIRRNTRKIVASFRRNDNRIRRRLARKYWKRAHYRADWILHAATNFMVRRAVAKEAALALEDLSGIRKMYRRGGGQGTEYRFRLNSWPYWKVGWMLEYKSAWNGVTFIQLTKSDTYGSSSMCSACGERLGSPERGDAEHKRMLWCRTCGKWVDRDINASLNLSARGLARFASSLSRQRNGSQQASAWEKGPAGEAMRGNPTTPVILRADAGKLALPKKS